MLRPQWLEKSCAVWTFSNSPKLELIVHNCCGHISSMSLKEDTQSIKRDIRYLPNDVNHLTQPYDLFAHEIITLLRFANGKHLK